MTSHIDAAEMSLWMTRLKHVYPSDEPAPQSISQSKGMGTRSLIGLIDGSQQVTSQCEILSGWECNLVLPLESGCTRVQEAPGGIAG